MIRLIEDKTNWIADNSTNQNLNANVPAGATEQTNQPTDKVQTMEIGFDAVPVVNTGLKMVEPTKPYAEDRIHSLTDVLERPYLISKLSWTSNDAQYSRLQWDGGSGVNSMIHCVKRSLHEIPNFTAKISGYAYVKHDTEIRILMNGQRFQAGKLLVGFFPAHGGVAYGDYPAGRDSGFPGDYDGAGHCRAIATLEHVVELDVATTTEAVLTLPYFSDSEAWEEHTTYPRPNEDYYMVAFVLNPLTGSTTGESVDISVYAAPVNMEVHLPSAQSRSEEQKKTSKGVVSSTLDTVSEVAGALTSVPFLSEIAGPVSWISSAASGVASMFGFSKPTSEGASEKRSLVPAFGYTNMTGLDQSQKLALTPENAVEQEHVKDEMIIRGIGKRKGLIATRSWDFEDPVGTQLWGALVTPMIHDTMLGPEKQQWRTPTPLNFLGSMFQYWRGDITFRVSFAKNTFYSGRVLFVWTPGNNTPNFNIVDKCYRKMLDVKDANDFTITIPYVNRTNYLSTIANPNNENVLGFANGNVSLWVENRLNSAETVAPSIQFNVWVSSPNIEFSVPREILRGAARCVVPFGSTPSDVPLAQSILGSSNSGSTDIKTDYLFKTSGLGLKAPAYTMGEVVTSLRTLTRRFTQFVRPINSYNISSKMWVIDRVTAAVPDNAYQNQLQYIITAYRFVRGGLRWKVFPTNPNRFIMAEQRQEAIPNEEGLASQPARNHAGFSAIAPGWVEPVLELETPFYSPYVRRFCTNYKTAMELRADRTPVTNVHLEDAAGLTDVTNPRYIMLAGADDFTASYWLMAPFTLSNDS